MTTGERIGMAWQAVLDRLPDGWIIDRLQHMPKGGMVFADDGSLVAKRNVWKVHARPLEGYAWRNAGLKHLAEGFNATGDSPLEALLSLAVRAEKGDITREPRPAQLKAVDDLFAALFGDAA